jgi:hypothetical protein
MFGSGGLLLIVPHVYAVPISVFLAGLPKKQLNLDIQFTIQSYILSTVGDALRQNRFTSPIRASNRGPG